jgi:hypothetical protein
VFEKRKRFPEQDEEDSEGDAHGERGREAQKPLDHELHEALER